MPKPGQRRHPRYEVQDVHGSLLYRTTVKVRNVSVSGLSLESAERLQLGRAYAIRLAGAGEAVDVHGTIRWGPLSSARPRPGGETRAVYEAGLAFDDVFTGSGRSLLGFLEHHVVLSPQQRLTGRFRADALLPAALEARDEFEVLRLSLSGMLVRTALEASVESRFALELRLRTGTVPLEGRGPVVPGGGAGKGPVAGRVAFVQREEAEKGSVAAQLGIEFVGGTDEARGAVARFIAEELERGPGDPPDGSGPAAS